MIIRKRHTVAITEDAPVNQQVGDAVKNGAESSGTIKSTEDKVASNKSAVASEMNKRTVAKKTYETARTQATTNINQIRSKAGGSLSAEDKELIVKEYNKIRAAKTAYEEVAKSTELNMIELNSRIAAMDGDIDDNIIESASARYSMALFEALREPNKTAMLAGLIHLSFDSLSTQPTETQCSTIAKNVIGHMNKNGWADGEDHWTEFRSFIENAFSNGRISLGRNEVGRFFSSLESELRVNKVFSWSVFGMREPSVVDEMSENVGGDNGSWAIDDVEVRILDLIFDSDEYGPLVDDGVIELDYDRSSVTIHGTEELANEVSLFVEGLEGKKTK